MIELKDITTSVYIKNGLLAKAFYHEDIMGVDLLLENNITNFSKLYQYMISHGIENKRLLKEMQKALKLIKKIESNTEQTLIFPFREYELSEFDPSSFLKVDQNTYGNILPIFPIHYPLTNWKLDISKYSISKIKYLLNHIHTNGKNALDADITQIGKNRIELIKKGIQLYHEQVLRLARSAPHFEQQDQLFFKDQLKKQEMIATELRYILEYLLNQSSHYIWSKDSDYQKYLLSSALENNTQESQFIKERLTQLFSNYVTLEELQTEDIRPKILERFCI